MNNIINSDGTTNFSTFSTASITGSSQIVLNSSNRTITASVILANLVGNATTATSATTAILATSATAATSSISASYSTTSSYSLKSYNSEFADSATFANESGIASSASWCSVAAFTKGNVSGSSITASSVKLQGATTSEFVSGYIPIRKLFSISDRGGFGSFGSYGDHTGSRMGEFYFHDTQGVDPNQDGGVLNCDIIGGQYEWHLDVIVGGSGTRCLSANTSGIYTALDISADGNYIAKGATGFTGPLNDSTSTKIADVVGGIIVATYF